MCHKISRHIRTAVASQLSLPTESIVLKYLDDENDELIISTDASLHAAIHFATSSGLNSLKVKVVFKLNDKVRQGAMQLRSLLQSSCSSNNTLLLATTSSM